MRIRSVGSVRLLSPLSSRLELPVSRWGLGDSERRLGALAGILAIVAHVGSAYICELITSREVSLQILG